MTINSNDKVFATSVSLSEVVGSSPMLGCDVFVFSEQIMNTDKILKVCHCYYTVITMLCLFLKDQRHWL